MANPLSFSPNSQIFLILSQEVLCECSNPLTPSSFFYFYNLAPGYILTVVYISITTLNYLRKELLIYINITYNLGWVFFPHSFNKYPQSTYFYVADGGLRL